MAAILPSSRVSLCLNMIVKNESKIILRLLQSVLSIIDTYIICDTGSTDNTPEIITNFFNTHNIKGEVIYQPFKNFGYNRTYAFNYAKQTYQHYISLNSQLQQQQQQQQLPQQVIPVPANKLVGGRRLRVRTKKHSCKCRCKRK